MHWWMLGKPDLTLFGKSVQRGVLQTALADGGAQNVGHACEQRSLRLAEEELMRLLPPGKLCLFKGNSGTL